MIAGRKLPAYGKRLVDVISRPECWRDYAGTSPDGSGLSIWVAIGPEAWQFARDRGRMLIAVIPEGENPENFNFSFVRGQDPILIEQCGECGIDFIQAVVAALIRDGARRVLHYDDALSQLPNELSNEQGNTLYEREV